MADELKLRIETGKLEEAASRIQTQAQNLRSAFQGMTDAMERTKNCWIGEAGERHRQLFFFSEEKREEAVGRFLEQAEDLLEMAGVYVSKENENREMAESLLGDVIL